MKPIFSDMTPIGAKSSRLFFAEEIDTDGTRKVYRFASKKWRDEWANRPGLPTIRRPITAKRGRSGSSHVVIMRG